jgi:hypothetical protein
MGLWFLHSPDSIYLETTAMLKQFLGVLFLAVLITACSSVNPQTTQPLAATTSPAQSDTLLATSVEATATALPSTVTPLPSETPLPPSPTPGPVAYGPADFPADINPLTGLQVSDPSLLNRRPLSVKVQIFPRNQRPPFGVTLADIVYDYYQNNGMTRFHAIFYANDAERVSPIRSGRLFDQHLVRMYKSILAFGGADRRILQVFLNSDFSDRLVLEGARNCPPMCRVDPNGFNFLVTNTAELSKYATEKGIDNSQQNLDGMSFHPTPPEGGQSAQQAFIRFSISAYVRWDYDSTSGRYLRFQDTQETASAEGEGYAAMIDGLTSQQISADNVVVIYVPHAYAFQTKPGSGSEIIDIMLSGSGPGYAMRDGQIYEVSWNRPEKTSVLSLTDPDGNPFPFKPGNTWFEVIGKSSKMESPAAGVWRFTFSIP